MPSHTLSQPDEVPAPLLCSCYVELRFGFPFSRAARRWRRVSAPPPPYSEAKRVSESKREKAELDEEQGQAARRGPVRVEEAGGAMRSWFFKINWLVLKETHLELHPSANTAPRAVIRMSEIAKLARTDVGRYCLRLETKDNRQYLLSFQSDNDLYGWQDAICWRFTGVSAPINFVHKIHVSVDPRNRQQYVGLPDQWVKLLSYPQGQLHPIYSRPLPRDVPSDVAENVLLRIMVDTPKDPGPTSTTLSFTPETRMRDVIDRVCRKVGVLAGERAGCGLVVAGDGARTPLGLDETVADLQDRHNLILVIPSREGCERESWL
ncbi:hypothetical protein FB451DRAFT_165791 [Mycena latifolia]|nr:hypothetical protein FB451DRAFT_165791 [Mycena latifolia]